MRHLANIVRFGWTYLRRYWSRMTAGILLGVLFGLSNASFIWATQTLFERLDPKSGTEAVVKEKAVALNQIGRAHV